jgi:hypothetical protein
MSYFKEGNEGNDPDYDPKEDEECYDEETEIFSPEKNNSSSSSSSSSTLSSSALFEIPPDIVIFPPGHAFVEQYKSVSTSDEFHITELILKQDKLSKIQVIYLNFKLRCWQKLNYHFDDRSANTYFNNIFSKGQKT